MDKNSWERESPLNYEILFCAQSIDDSPVWVKSLGEVDLPTGRIHISDLFLFSDGPTLDKKVPPGSYPIQILYSANWILMARIIFQPKPAQRWILAFPEDMNPQDLPEESIVGVGVDHGMIIVMDHKVLSTLEDYEEKSGWNEDEEYDDPLEDKYVCPLEDRLDDYDDASKPCAFLFEVEGISTAVVESGMGDGVYPMYWGLQEGGEIVSLVVDFELVDSSSKVE